MHVCLAGTQGACALQATSKQMTSDRTPKASPAALADLLHHWLLQEFVQLLAQCLSSRLQAAAVLSLSLLWMHGRLLVA